MQGCIPFLLEGGGKCKLLLSFVRNQFNQQVFLNSIHMHVPGCGKAKGKTIYPTGAFSIVPMGKKTLDITKSITHFHRFEKINCLELH